MSMKKSFKFFEPSQKRLINLFGSYGCGQWEIPPGYPFGQADDIRGDIFMIAGEHFSGSAKSRGNFIGNEQ